MCVGVCCLCAGGCYLSCGPGGALTDVRHTKAKTVSAAKLIFLLQVVEPWFTQVTVSSHHVLLREGAQVREQMRHQGTGENRLRFA